MNLFILIILLFVSDATTQPAADAIKGALPAEVGGLKRAAGDAQSVGATTVAAAIYSGDGTSKHFVLIVSLYSDPDTAAGLAPWFIQNVNDAAGGKTRRTARIAGFRSLEEYDPAARSGSVSIRLSDRSIAVMLYNDFAEAEAIRAAEQLPLAALATIN